MIRLALPLLALCALATARFAYQFPVDYEYVLRSNLVETFSCENLPYGYYADIENNCQVFHICLPVTDGQGDLIETAQFSFLCGNETVFSQESLSCVFESEAYPCDQARSLFEISNAEFGILPERED
ncbi:UNVERIFIED_CONTAM: hypothetical protein GTU68_050356 [Idotea baltica]|nr:hypothetical protein [Idotea baltica]